MNLEVLDQIMEQCEDLHHKLSESRIPVAITTKQQCLNSLPETVDLQDLLTLIAGLAIANKTLFQKMGLIERDLNFEMFQQLLTENAEFLEETYKSWTKQTGLNDKGIEQLLRDKLGGV